MKKILTLLVFMTFLGNSCLLAQSPPNPPPDAGASSPTGPVGNGAPVDDGVFILIGLAGLLAGKKVYDLSTGVRTEE